jgi:ATP-dependent RNA helicase DDX51/DBP6
MCVRVICSDMMTRGMDLGTNVEVVVNYDVPSYVKTYIHRVGRTARAGRDGIAITIAKRSEMKHFKDELKKTDNSKLNKWKHTPQLLEEHAALLEECLAELRKTIHVELKRKDFVESKTVHDAITKQAALNFFAE